MWPAQAQSETRSVPVTTWQRYCQLACYAYSQIGFVAHKLLFVNLCNPGAGVLAAAQQQFADIRAADTTQDGTLHGELQIVSDFVGSPRLESDAAVTAEPAAHSVGNDHTMENAAMQDMGLVDSQQRAAVPDGEADAADNPSAVHLVAHDSQEQGILQPSASPAAISSGSNGSAAPQPAAVQTAPEARPNGHLGLAPAAAQAQPGAAQAAPGATFREAVKRLPDLSSLIV